MSSTRKLVRFALAILLTSLAAGLYFAAIALRAPTLHEALGAVIAIAFLAVPIVAIVGLLVGMPVAFLLKTIGARGYIVWGTVGLLTGAVVSVLFAVLVEGAIIFGRGGASTLVWMGICAVPGLAAGMIWWRVVGRYEQNEAH